MNRSIVKVLKKKPRIPGVTGAFRWRFLESRIGTKDAKENQICEVDDVGHITPWIHSKEKFGNSYIDKIYLNTAIAIDEIVQEANALVVELNIIVNENNKPSVPSSGNSEEAKRQMMKIEAKKISNEARKKEILIKISTIKAESDMIDEALNHHIEAARNILDTHVSAYWRGILKSTDLKLAYVPVRVEYNGEGRRKYNENRENLVDKIENGLKIGGIEHEAA